MGLSWDQDQVYIAVSVVIASAFVIYTGIVIHVFMMKYSYFI